MTKILVRYNLLRPLDETLLKRISDAHGIYGIYRITVEPTLDHITVEYDASRLSRDRVESALHKRGIPVRPVDTTVKPAENPANPVQR